ncbi:MAG: Gfo/Idh/MocA family oxidoreductase [Planctomycetes bacterium]|nr:Gfo/Idh/MocA family oxidoreductase [Planctomycetota bacterium]
MSDSSTSLRACVVGVGHLGRHHARILAELPDIELVAVIDANAERGQEIAGRYGCRWQPEVNEIENEIDFAVIATPTVVHEECAAPFLAAGKACLIEKPMAPDPESCQRILKAAESGGAMVGVGHVERFNPAVRRARELGVQPRFIEAHRLAPYTFRSTDVGVVLDLMIHDIDLCLAWTDSQVVDVDAVGGATLSPSEDIVSARLRFSDGSAANLTASRLSLKPMRRFRFFGPDSYVSVDSGDRYALLVQKAEGFSPEKVAEAASSGSPIEGFRSLLEVEELHLDEIEPLRAELEAFAAAVRSGMPHEVSGEAGAAAVEVAYRVLASLEASGWSGN